MIKNKLDPLLRLLSALLLSHFLPLNAGAQVHYTVTRLVPETGVQSNAVSINSQGDVVGRYIWRASHTSHTFLYHAGILHNIGGAAWTYPCGINKYGRIAGSGSGSSNFTYFQGNIYQLSHIPPNSTDATGLNDLGQIIGTGEYGSDIWIWQKSGVTKIPAPRGYTIVPIAINNSSQIAGIITSIPPFYWENGIDHAFLYSASHVMDLGTLPGGTNSMGWAINDQGQVAGYSDTSSAAFYHGHAVIFSAGNIVDIHNFGNGANSFANGINNLGQVVGQYGPVNVNYAFIYNGTQSTDLNTLIPSNSGWVLQDADAINDAGQIAGTGIYNNENYVEAFLLTPIQ
jgi:probable HAF family extracellular repeat protein